MTHLRFSFGALALVACLFVGILLVLELGRRAGLRRTAKSGSAAKTDISVVSSAVYSVFALLLGFTFAGATSRFDQRRDLIIGEANAISTAWQRTESLLPEPRARVREQFQRYVDALIDSYVNPAPVGSAKASQQAAAVAATTNDLWTGSMAAVLAPGGEPARMLLLPSLNEMFDVVDRERFARRMHPPAVIWIMLGVTALAASLFAGYNMSNSATRNWLFMVILAGTISIVTYVIIDIEYPRLGFVRVDSFDRELVRLRSSLEE
jgi:hypothetical protein